MSEFGAERVSWRGVGNFILELSDLHDFFRQCSLYNILLGFLKFVKKIWTFSTFKGLPLEK